VRFCGSYSRKLAFGCPADAIVAGRHHMEGMTGHRNQGKHWPGSSIPRGWRTWAASLALVSVSCFLSPAIAQVARPEGPSDTLRCEGFKKTADGTWYAENGASFHVGGAKEVTVRQQVIGPGSHKIGGLDLYALLERKCAGSRA
jgi:hypothetical protein